MEEIVDLHLSKYEYIGDTGKIWERFYDEADRFSLEFERTKDESRFTADNYVDQYRGGEIKPN